MSVRRTLFRLASVGMIAVACAASLRAQTTVTVSPSSKNALPGATFTLTINVNSVSHLHAVHTVVRFNNAVLQATTLSFGTFLTGPLGVLSFSQPPLGPAVDSVTVDQAILGNYSVSGSGILYSMTFSAVGAGLSSVTISTADLRDTSSLPIPATITSGSVNVANPAQIYVDPAYTPGSSGGHEFGYDAFNALSPALDAVSSGGTMNIAPATYSAPFNVTKNVTLAPSSGTPIFQSITVNTPVVSLGGNVQVSGLLTLTNGVLMTGANKVSVTADSAGAVVITSGSVNGQIDRLIAAGAESTYVFTDSNTSLRPSGTQGLITASVRSFPGTTPPNINGGSAINRYYVITPSGALTARVRLSYLDSEINSVPELSMTLFRSTGTVWTPVASTPNPAGNFVEAQNVSSFSSWTIGDEDHPLPIQLASFTTAVQSNGDVRLTWVTLSEVNNYGFYVQRKRPSDQGFVDVVNSFVPGNGTTNEPHTYTFSDPFPGNGLWSYRLRQVDLDGTVHYSDPVQVDVVTAVGGDDQPTVFSLKQNYPNPFNPSTTIGFSLPKAGYTTLKIYNILGKEVASLIDGVVAAGRHSVKWDASALPTGMYLYKLSSGGFVETMKLVLMK